MNRKILFVDDEENVLRGFERALRSQFEMETAVGSQEGLAALASRGPYAVVVSDLRMPVMDGIQFLAEVRKSSPDTVRLILSGNGDFESVVASVNEGSIFQFLTKPCPPDKLRSVLGIALKQYQLITAERELLEETLNGSIGMLTEVLSVVNPLAFSRASRIRTYVRHMANELQLPEPVGNRFGRDAVSPDELYRGPPGNPGQGECPICPLEKRSRTRSRPILPSAVI